MFEEYPVLEITHQYVNLPALKGAALQRPGLSLDDLANTYREVIATYAKREFKLLTREDLRFQPSGKDEYSNLAEAEKTMISYFDKQTKNFILSGTPEIAQKKKDEARHLIAFFTKNTLNKASLQWWVNTMISRHSM